MYTSEMTVKLESNLYVGPVYIVLDFYTGMKIIIQVLWKADLIYEATFLDQIPCLHLCHSLP